MYSIEHTRDDPFGGRKVITPQGQHVSVTVMRERGAKVTYAQLDALEPMIGYIRKEHDNGVCMAYRYNGYFTLETGNHQPREIARLYSPVIQEWNRDGQIYQGWVLERWEDDKMHQVVQLWWIRQLEALPAKAGISKKSRDTA